MSNDYISNINLRNRQHKEIPAGTIFTKEELFSSTFNALVEQGHVVESKLGVPPPPVIVRPSGKRVMAIGLENKTPTAAINPPKTKPRYRREPEKLTAEQRQEKEEIRVKIKEVTGKLPPHNTRLDTLNDMWDQILAKQEAPAEDIKKAEETSEKSADDGKSEKAACVWDLDPDTVKDTPMEQLMSLYLDRCIEFKIEPENFEDRDLLVAKLCSEFTSK